MRVIRLIRVLGGFTLLQALGYIAPFAALPVVARTAGTAGWVHIAAAQAIGTLASVVILFGWWTAGPGEYHRLTTTRERVTLYRRSHYERVLIAIAALPLAAVAVIATTPSDWDVTCLLVMLAMASYGFTPSWLFVAKGQPGKLALFETLPRSGATLVSVGVVLALGQVWPYPVLQLLFVSISYAIALRRECPARVADPIHWKSLTMELRQHIPIALSNVLGAVYSQLSVPLASGLAPAASVAPYVSGDKLYRASRFSIVALGNTLQGWALEADSRRRHLAAIAAHGAFGLIGGIAIGAITPWMTAALFGSGMGTTYSVSAALGVAFLAASVSTPLIRNVLIPHGHRRLPLVGTTAATVVGLGGLFPLYGAFGVSGVAYAVAASEVVNTLVNAWAVRTVLARLPASESRTEPVQATPQLT